MMRLVTSLTAPQRSPDQPFGMSTFESAGFRREASNFRLVGSSNPPTISAAIEREVKFLADGARLFRALDIHGLEPVAIEQAYLSKAHAPFVRAIAIESCAGSDHRYFADATHARIRHEYSANYETYDLTLKSKRSGPASIERRELQIPLSPASYNHLKTMTIAQLQKLRLETEGWIRDSSGSKQTVIAHIDILLSCGKTSSTPKLEPSSYALREAFQSSQLVTIDIELPSRELLKPLRNGNHSFDFLRDVNAVELTQQAPSIRKSLGSRRIAKSGMDHEAILAVRALLK